MNDAEKNEHLLLDAKKNRIRVRKSTLHRLGNPLWIQLLFNPEDMVVAIRCVDKKGPDGQEIKISTQKMNSDNSIEMYSLTLISKIREVTNVLDDGYSYRLSGSICRQKRTAYFPMSSLVRLESE